jgi:hypothetical protein
MRWETTKETLLRLFVNNILSLRAPLASVRDHGVAAARSRGY